MERLTSLGLSVLQLFLTLPPITQWAVAMLIVCALLAHIFAYNETTIHEGPSIFTTAGIFFTFLGIAEGLYEFDPQRIDASNAIRQSMGASLREYVAAPSHDVLTVEELERLAGEGIEIPLDEVKVLNDGTHVYKGKRVVVYIRDVAQYGTHVTMPKYHLAMCNTLSKMMEEGRYKKRYVVATREDGKFSIQRIRNEVPIKSDEALDVCQHCLDELHYNSFSRGSSPAARNEIVRSFSLKKYFEEFGKSCVWAVPRFDAVHAPTNVYSHQFYRIAKAIKEGRGYRCEEPDCRIDLSNRNDQRFLHAHHIDADKSDSHPTNIKLLCIRCHAGQFQHAHLKDNPDYSVFCRKYPKIDRNAAC